MAGLQTRRRRPKDVTAVTRAETLVRQLSLRPHPEGGWYSEVFRSRECVTPADRRSERSALTSIYFLLAAGQVSRWHRVMSDEAWHFYEGDAVELFSVDPNFERLERTVLGRLAEDPAHDQAAVRPTHVVPAGHWQGVRITGAYALVGCSVGPGFDFADFTMLSDDGPAAVKLTARFPDLAGLV
jgi:predicted cupin superfamily sugar epimerase